MMEATSSSTTQLGQQRSYFGGRPQRLFFLGLVSLLARAFEVFLLLTVKRVPLSTHVPATAYLLPFFHLLPWLAGLSCWGVVKRSRVKDAISLTAADLCYGMIIALLSATYVVLGLVELTLMPWVKSGKHLGLR
jgi:hypothetical protein